MSTASAEAAATLPDLQGQRGAHMLAFGRADALNVALLLGVFALVLLIVPPVRTFPMIDDWIYKHQVDKLLTWQYSPHPWAQAAGLSHVAWGALFALFLGSSYTVLSMANLVASGLCLVVFYRLMRVLDVSAPLALFGSALLLAQPMYFHLSTTFMTDVTFLCTVLLACLFWVRWVQTERNGYLWAASVAVALVFLNRQFGVALIGVLLAYMWVTRKLTWSRVIASVLIPLIVVGAYYVWERGQPPLVISRMIELDFRDRIQDPLQWLVERASFASRALTISALFLIPLFRWARKPLLSFTIGSILCAVLLRTYLLFGSFAPFMGDVVDEHGFVDCCEVLTPTVWNTTLWAVLMLVGVVSASFLLSRVARRIDFSWVRNTKAVLAKPAALVYGSAGVLTAAALVGPPTFFDRYYLPLVAALILFAVREWSSAGIRRQEAALRWALLVPVLLFTVAAQHDSMEFNAIRWQASHDLVSQGIGYEKIGRSFEWGGEYLFEAEWARISRSGDFSRVRFAPFYVMDPQYYVSEIPIKGYDVVRTEEYSSWLEVGLNREVLVLKRR